MYKSDEDKAVKFCVTIAIIAFFLLLWFADTHPAPERDDPYGMYQSY